MRRNNITQTIITSLLFIWIGFIGAISFMEAWLKFKAEGVTQRIGVSIGNKVFNALNKVEITIALIIIIALFFNKNYFFKKSLIKLIIPFSSLIIQSTYLLPTLDKRAQLIIKEIHIENSYDHIIYIVLEIIKITALIIIGIQILTKNEYK